MGFWDFIITFAIVASAAFYTYRKFAGTRKGDGCGCSSGSGGCGGHGGKSSDSCCASRPR